jgi:tetratricopeptide (TPR) repeat protein
MKNCKGYSYDQAEIMVRKGPFIKYVKNQSFYRSLWDQTMRHLFGSVFLLGVMACASNETWDDPIIYSGSPSVQQPLTPADKMESLNRAIKQYPKLARDVADVRAILIAEELEAAHDTESAVSHWREALEKARGPFGQKAFEGWVRAYAVALGKKTDAKVLARLILSETREGEISPYMTANSLTTEMALIPKLRNLVPEWLSQDPKEETKTTVPPNAGEIPIHDPLLIKTAGLNCSQRNLDRTAWSAWASSLPPAVQTYWRALVEQCSGQTKAALSSLEESFPKLVPSQKTQSMALEAITRTATIQRAIGRRKEAADTYIQVVKAWNFPGVTSQGMGLDTFALIKRRVEDTLWASRYRALFGDHESAKIYAQDSLDLVNAAYTVGSNLNTTMRDQLALLKVESYHSLAFRIAVQKKEYQSALSLTQLALETPGIDTEWKERLLWFAGLYEFLDGQYASARKRWEGLLAQVKDPSQRAMIYFWLARTTSILDQSAESRFYLNAITDEYPVSFYATIAPTVAGLKPDRGWETTFGSYSELVTKLQTKKDFGLVALRNDRDLGPLIRRAEILVKANIAPWAHMAIEELERAMNRTMSPESNAPPFIYLTRLYHRVGSYLKTISLTTKIAKGSQGFWKQWPEQILIYFPRPLGDAFERSAQENQVDKDLLYGIARQESGFVTDIRSGANAIGVMQLIRPTAERFAPQLGIADKDLDAALRDPMANVRLGGRYLKSLSLMYEGFPPGVYGGYNAGELAIDLWRKHRSNPDPLAFIELVPFGETKDYIKGVWRNIAVYHFLEESSGRM